MFSPWHPLSLEEKPHLIARAINLLNIEVRMRHQAQPPSGLDPVTLSAECTRPHCGADLPHKTSWTLAALCSGRVT